jgi:hypothetical protein
MGDTKMADSSRNPNYPTFTSVNGLNQLYSTFGELPKLKQEQLSTNTNSQNVPLTFTSTGPNTEISLRVLFNKITASPT